MSSAFARSKFLQLSYRQLEELGRIDQWCRAIDLAKPGSLLSRSQHFVSDDTSDEEEE